MLSNAHFLAKFRLDTAEKEPAKKLAKFSKNAFSKNATQAAQGGRNGGRAAICPVSANAGVSQSVPAFKEVVLDAKHFNNSLDFGIGKTPSRINRCKIIHCY